MEKMVEVERATQDELRQDLKSLFQGAIRVTLEMVLEEELKAMVGARRFERVGSRKDHRNGTYLRRLLTSLGQIDVMVPRSREGAVGEGGVVRAADDVDHQFAGDLRHRQTLVQVVSQKHASLPSDHRRLPSPGGRRQALRSRTERLLRPA